MTVVAGDVLRTVVRMALIDGTVCQNTFYHKRSGITVLSNQDHVDALELWVEDAYATLATYVKNDVVEQLCFVDRIEWSGTKWETVENVGIFTPTVAYAGAGEMLPNQMSAYVILKTARPKTTGKKFLLPFMEGAQGGSYLVAAALEDLADFAAECLTNIDVYIGINHLTPGVVRSGFDVWYDFDVAIVTNLLGSQKRRRPGVGS